jgi:hypothetical protein
MQRIAGLISVAAVMFWAATARTDTNEFRLDFSRTNGAWQFLFSPTVSNAPYQLLGRGDMGLGNWIVEADVPGFTNGTQTVYTIGNDGWSQRFFLAGSGADTDGDGLSDVYEIAVTKTSPTTADTGSTGVSDGYKDSDGDGQTDLEEYANRLDPFQFTTPAAPTDFFVTQASGQPALVRWMSAYGAVNGYVIQRKAEDAPESA